MSVPHEQTPRFRVTPEKGLFHCFGCEARATSSSSWRRRKASANAKPAVKLLTAVPGVNRSQPRCRKKGKTAEPKKILKPGDAAKRCCSAWSRFYAKTLHKDRAGFEYLKGRNLADATMLGRFQIGYCNGSLLKVLPKAGELLDGLKTLGVLKADGRRNIFEGCVTVPIFDTRGNVCGIYGRRVTDAEPQHLYLPGPHRGVWNGGERQDQSNPAHHRSDFRRDGVVAGGLSERDRALRGAGLDGRPRGFCASNPTREIFLCLDNDDGRTRRTVEKLERAMRRPPLVRQVHVVQWPEGVKDAERFFPAVPPTDFEALLKAADPQTGAAERSHGEGRATRKSQ